MRRRGCVPLEGKGKLNTAEWWITKDKQPFTVPVERGNKGLVEFWALHKLCEQLGIELPEIEE
ncbi:hypothetical protein [Maritalea sp.]|uniref:hypothetical protein n=1 Tax=Maritalea sp. TaxID=2003361 RepID=UPI003F4AAC02